MSLLPKNTKEFGSKDYWNSFFAGRGTDPFEWYGQYADLCGLLHTYIRPADRLLVAGCGNSTLSADLYSLGYKNITNVDVSEVVVRQMQARYQEACPDMAWCHDDLTYSSFCSDSFTCVLDKGTLDAIFTDDSPAVVETVSKYLAEVLRLLRVGGRYLCVSLLQEHILQHLLQWSKEHGCIVRFCRCVEAEQSTRKKGKFTLPVFVVVCTKLRPISGVEPVLESCLAGGISSAPPARVSRDALREQVMSLQQYSAVTHSLLTKVRAGEEARLELCHATTGQLRYVLYILDAPLSASPALPMGVFIVPQRREVEWLFSSVEGRRQLLESAGAGRLVVVHLVRDQLYESGLQQVQEELNSSVMDFAPHDLPKHFKVPFLTAGGDVGSVRRVCGGESSYSGKYVVEDVQADQGATLRRLVFLGNQNVVQSEVRLLDAPAQNGKAQTNAKKKKGKQKEQVQNSSSPSLDHSYLSCQHHLAMVGGLGLVGARGRGLLLGLGGGPLATYVHQHFPKITLNAVEIDEAMVKVAKQYFGFKTSSRLTVTVQDGLDFCEDKANEGIAYDFILLDVDSKDVSVGMSCPPQAFVTPSFLRILAACLRPEGVAVLNVVCRDSAVWQETVQRIKDVFGRVLCQNIPQEVNRLLFCIKSKDESVPESNLMDNFSKSLALVNKLLKSKSSNDDVIDVDDTIKNAAIL